MKNKKGFTLIELLAVIVVLAIIALIATPIVMNTIKNAKKGANERSIENYKKAVEQAFMNARVDGKLEEGYYRGSKTLVNGNSKVEVDYQGTEVSCAIIKYESSNITIDKCNIGSTPEESVDEYVLKTEYNAEIGDYVNYDPTKGGTVNATYISTQEKNGVTNQTFDISSYKGKWQILGIEGNGKIKLISSDIIEPTSGGSASSDGKYNYYQIKGEAGYINGVDELNKVGSLFAQGQYAESGRSVNLEDLIAISGGMDLNKVEHSTNPKMYHNSKTIGSYGYTVNYKYSNDGTKVNYTSENGSKMTIDANMFYHYDEATKSFIRNSNADKTKTYTLTNNLNEYIPYKVEKNNCDNYTCSYKWWYLLYGHAKFPYHVYFIATRRDYANPSGYNSYGIYTASGNMSLGQTLTKPTKDSNGNVSISESSKAYGIRVVVTLSDNASLVKSSSMSSNNINYSVFNVTKKGNASVTYKNGQEVYFNVTTGEKCSSSDYTETQSNIGVKEGCMKFYAFNDDGKDTVNLILDHNTTAMVAWNLSKSNTNGPSQVLTQLKSDTASWVGTITPSNYTMDQTGQTSNAKYTIDYSGYKARLITTQEIATITGNSGWDEKTASDYYYFDSKTTTASDTCKNGNTTGCQYGWLYDRTNKFCVEKGCLNKSDQETYGYWTVSSRASSSNNAWSVYYHGYVYYCNVAYSNTSGVRPVITVSKSQLG